MENIGRTKDIVQIEFDNFDYHNNQVNNINNYKEFDNNYIFLEGDSDLFSSDEISSEPKDFLNWKIMKSPYFKSISNMFS